MQASYRVFVQGTVFPERSGMEEESRNTMVLLTWYALEFRSRHDHSSRMYHVLKYTVRSGHDGLSIRGQAGEMLGCTAAQV